MSLIRIFLEHWKHPRNKVLSCTLTMKVNFQLPKENEQAAWTTMYLTFLLTRHPSKIEENKELKKQTTKKGLQGKVIIFLKGKKKEA